MKKPNTVLSTLRPYLPLAFILLMILMTFFFFIGGPDYQSPRSFKAFWNLGHILYFALLPVMLIVFSAKKFGKPLVQIVVILLVTLVFGTVVELLQYDLDRTPDLGDIFRDMIGAGVAICFLLQVRKSIPSVVLTIGRAVLILSLLTQIYPIGTSLLDEYRARRDFSILSDFQDSLQLDRWTGGATISNEAIGDAGNIAMRADLTTQKYSGVALKYFPMDWHRYRLFQFRVYNPLAETISITCRIHDKQHIQGIQEFRDRFNRTYYITKGWNTITIDLKDVEMAAENRRLDLREIYGVGIFAISLPHSRTIYIDDVRLL